MPFIANGNDVCKKEWQIVEISPTKKYFNKKSKSLETKKGPKQKKNPEKPEGIKSIAKLVSRFWLSSEGLKYWCCRQ